MYVIREVVHCKPGKVKQMLEKFRGISKAAEDIVGQPFRLMTDVTGEPFWTLVAEIEVERIDDFFTLEQEVMANEAVLSSMANYHDLVESGRREICRIET